MSALSLLPRLWKPIDAERRRLLAERWLTLPERLRKPGQAIGRYAVACGATHGVHERCNFGCTACYLGSTANQQPPMPFAKVEAQLIALRERLGPGGNVQITSGEVTLLPVDELKRIVRAAVDLQLSPMVMSHGDVWLHNPAYLETLVRAARLRKVSIHVDTTQRGRKNHGRVDSEEALNTVRDQMATLLREIRRRTGIRLKAATTMTVNRQNLTELPTVLHWFRENLDAFRVLSFNPQAATGRTTGDNGVEAEEVWAQLESALGMRVNPHAFHFGHEACTRIALILALETGNQRILLQAVRPDREMDRKLMDAFMADFGGVVINDRPRAEVIATLLGACLRRPVWFPRLMHYVVRRLWQERKYVPACLKALLSGRLRMRPMALVVHAFMSPEQLVTPKGRERVEACAFRLSVDGQFVSMCEMNATSLRESSYQASQGVPLEV